MSAALQGILLRANTAVPQRSTARGPMIATERRRFMPELAEVCRTLSGGCAEFGTKSSGVAQYSDYQLLRPKPCNRVPSCCRGGNCARHGYRCGSFGPCPNNHTRARRRTPAVEAPTVASACYPGTRRPHGDQRCGSEHLPICPVAGGSRAARRLAGSRGRPAAHLRLASARGPDAAPGRARPLSVRRR